MYDVDLMKYMFIRHFKMMWYFLNEYNFFGKIITQKYLGSSTNS